MYIALELDVAEYARFRADMEAAASQLSRGLPDVMLHVGQLFAAGINEQFLRGGIPKWQALSPRTIAERLEWQARTGRKLAAGLHDPERVTDELRLASVATVPGVMGSAFLSSAVMVQVGPDERKIDYAADQNFGDPAHNLPARTFIVVSDETETRATALTQTAIESSLAPYFYQEGV